MTKLFKKLFRDIKKSFGQFIAVIIVSSIGVMLLTGLAVAHSTLLNTTNEYYRQSNLASLSAYYMGINDVGVNKINQISGVEDAYGRIDLKAVSSNNQSDFLVHTVSSDEKINIPTLQSGHIPQTDSECMIDNAYATAHHLKTNDKLSVILNKKTYNFTISGIFNSSEYIYLIEDPAKSAIPNHDTFGLLYVNKSLISSFTGNANYNDVLVTLKPNVSLSLVSKEIENATKDYGFGKIVLQKDQLSYAQLQSDIDTAAAVSKVFPYIFFLVSALIIFISMSRTVQSERNQIGVMKALGIRSSSITIHYLSYSVMCGVVGSLLGNLIGIITIPNSMFSSYSMLYTFPTIRYSGYLWYIIMSTIVVVLFGVVASLLSARKVLKEVPAQCMRPLPPKKVHKTWLEKNEKLWSRISYKNKLIIRNILLNKSRAILSSIGVVGCVGMLMFAFGLNGALNNMYDMQFNKIQIFDDMVILTSPVPYNAPMPFNNDNIQNTDKVSVIPASIILNKDIGTNLYALPQDNKSIQLYDTNNNKLSLPDDGIVVPYKLAQQYNIKVGDTISVRFESAAYKSESIKARVAAIDTLYLSQDLYVSYEYMQKLGVTPYVIGYYVNVSDKSLLTKTNTYISSATNIRSVMKNSDIKAETTSTMGMMSTLVFLMILMSAALALAVIFNISSINIFERRRDIATLKVLGYHKKEINSLVHTENFIITAFGSIFGIGFGVVIYNLLIGSIVGADMYLPNGISVSVITISVLLAFVFTLFANIMLRGKTHKIDMVESLKSVE